jgi:hypothetical protein
VREREREGERGRERKRGIKTEGEREGGRQCVGRREWEGGGKEIKRDKERGK